MQELTKTFLNKKIWKHIDDRSPIEGDYLLKNTETIVHVNISFTERETFIDANGVKWVKA